MVRYVAFLRGINVSGKNIIKMEDLREIFDSLGFKNTTTYIQSGNVLFEADENNVRASIEKKLRVSATTRNWATLNKILEL